MKFQYGGFDSTGQIVTLKCLPADDKQFNEVFDRLCDDVNPQIQPTNYTGPLIELQDYEDEPIDLSKFSDLKIELSLTQFHPDSSLHQFLSSLTPAEDTINQFLDNVQKKAATTTQLGYTPSQLPEVIEIEASIKPVPASSTDTTPLCDPMQASPTSSSNEPEVKSDPPAEQSQPSPLIQQSLFSPPAQQPKVEIDLRKEFGYVDTVPLPTVAQYVLLEGIVKSDLSIVNKAIDAYYKTRREELANLFYQEPMGNHINHTALMHVVASEGNVAIAKLLKEAGADIHAISIIGPDRDRETTLLAAIYSEHAEMQDWLQEQGVNHTAIMVRRR